MDKTMKEHLLELAEEDYRIFSSKLLPNTKHILGVRLPLLRKIAKQIVKEDWRTYLNTSSCEYYEEIMLQGMVIGYAKADIEEILAYVTEFVPKIDNWSVCDSFCTGLKITKENKERVWEYLQPYFLSAQEFDVRFGVVMLLDFYIEKDYLHQVLNILDHIKQDGYYVKMATAWAISICYIKLPESTFLFLNKNHLDDFTYNKALQKITESLTIDKETKSVIRRMKRK